MFEEFHEAIPPSISSNHLDGGSCGMSSKGAGMIIRPRDDAIVDFVGPVRWWFVWDGI